MALYSKLPLKNLEVRNLLDVDIPSIKTQVFLRSGKMLNLFAIHPRPPHPGRGSGQRDAELILLARDVRKSGKPTIIMGDFNDVSWSGPMGLFHEIGSTIDPREGNGFFATFNARNFLIRWPLDHIFFTDDFGLMKIETGANVGSDHYPIIVKLCQNERRFAPFQLPLQPAMMI